MNKSAATMLLLLIVIHLSACSPAVNVRNDIFRSKPIWETYVESQSGPAIDEKLKMEALTVKEKPSREAVLAKAPALSGLQSQVLHETVKASANSMNRYLKEAKLSLPDDIAALNVTKALVKSMSASYLGAHNIKTVPDNLSDLNLEKKDFTTLIDTLHDFTLSKNISLTAPQQTTLKDKEKKIKSSIASPSWHVSWEELFTGYLLAYFNGKFCDRTGACSSKPNIGLTIANDAISGLVGVFIESIYDYAIIGGGIKDPIVYESLDTKGNPIFVTTGSTESKVPTLWTILSANGAPTPTQKYPDISGIIEQVKAKDSKNGITKTKLCYIRAVSGQAGAVAQGSSGMIVKSFGGTNLGFSAGLGILGKFSFGDNDTLTKVVDTVTEGIGRRTTEIAISSYLYNVDLPSTPVSKELCGE